MKNAALSIENLYITRGGKELYRNFFFEAEENETACIIAPSGSGKTTLLNFIAGISDTQSAQISGEVFFGGKKERVPLSFLFQEPRLIQTISVLKNVALPLANVMREKEAVERAEYFLEKMELYEKKNAFPYELSGGEAQRLSAARSFAFPSKLLLMDEPFQSQDMRIKLHLIDILKKLLAEEKRTAVFVTHDVKEAVSLADRIVVMDGSPLCIVFDEKTAGKSAAETEKAIQNLVVHSVN